MAANADRPTHSWKTYPNRNETCSDAIVSKSHVWNLTRHQNPLLSGMPHGRCICLSHGNSYPTNRLCMSCEIFVCVQR
jgi:hypothetical protein